MSVSLRFLPLSYHSQQQERKKSFTQEIGKNLKYYLFAKQKYKEKKNWIGRSRSSGPSTADDISLPLPAIHTSDVNLVLSDFDRFINVISMHFISHFYSWSSPS